MNYSVLALDLDGTLLDEAKRIPDENIRALQEFRRQGGRTLLISGRTPLSTRWIATVLETQEIMVALNGAVIQDFSGRILEQTGFSREAVISFLAWCFDRKLYAHLYTLDTLLIPYKSRWNEFWLEKNVPLLAMGSENVARWADFRRQCLVLEEPDLPQFIVQYNPTILKMAAFSETGQLLGETAELKRQVQGLEISSSHACNIEISPQGVTKGTALRKIIKMLGISLFQVAAIGDNYNDLSMLESAGIGIAMGNAPKAVREQVTWVTDDNNKAGVAKAIQRHIFNQTKGTERYDSRGEENAGPVG